MAILIQLMYQERKGKWKSELERTRECLEGLLTAMGSEKPSPAVELRSWQV